MPPPGPLTRHPLLAPFRVRSFRYLWPADLLTSWAFEMETLILGWYVLVETRSVLWLTMFGALQYIGTLLSPLIGMLGDRLGHATVLAAMRAIYATLAASLMAIAFAGALSPVVVVVIGALCGLVRPSDLAVRQTIVAQTMPPEQLMGAMGIARTTSDTARICGALVGAGLFAALGMGRAYVFVTTCYLLGLGLTLRIAAMAKPVVRPSPPRPSPPRSSPLREMKEGLVYVWSRPHMLAGFWLAFLVNLTAFPLSGGLLPYVAREVYRVDQTGLGLLAASFASGALAGSISLTILGRTLRPGRTMIVAALIWYALLLMFAQMHGILAGGVFLMLAGFAQSWSMIPLAVMLLRTADDGFRGRVMGARMLAIYSLPMGLLIAGALISRIGFQATATVYAVIGLACTAMIAWHWRLAVWRLDGRANAG